MKPIKYWLALSAVAALTVACGKSPATDDSLKNDLALASQAQQSPTQQVVSPAEQGYAANPYTTPVLRTQSSSRAPVQTVRRTSAPRRSSSSDVVYAPAPAPAPQQTVKHTQRDAAIGAATGAVIGAVTSRDKVKGGLIGAAAGAILGGVIGNNVDITRKP
ncbi:MAG TPA: YMGG-like glycine zipper-containing protein [Gemmatimonadaceae bacterium]|jgi:uncharacterized protein YcfJ